MVRVAIMPFPFPGIDATMKGGSRVSFSEREERFGGDLEVKAGNREMRRAMCGFVRKEIPRLLWKVVDVKTQNLVLIFWEHVGYIVHGSEFKFANSVFVVVFCEV
jgi:hypothetical protein